MTGRSPRNGSGPCDPDGEQMNRSGDTPWRLLGYVRPYWRQGAIAALAMAAGAGAQVMRPYLIQQAIDGPIAAGRAAGLERLAAWYLLSLAVAFAADLVHIYVVQTAGQRVLSDLRLAVWRRLQRLDLAFYDRHPVGQLLTRVTSDGDAINELFASGVIRAVADVIMIVGIAAMMIWMNGPLAAVVLATLPLMFLVTRWFRRNIRRSYRRVRGCAGRINAVLQEHLAGMETVQLFQREALDAERFVATDARHRDANIESSFYYAVFYPAIEAISALAAALIIWYGGSQVLRSELSLGALVAFLQATLRFFQPLSELSEKFNVVQSALASAERMFAVIDEPVTIQSPLRPMPRATPAAGHVVFDHVWFAYPAVDGTPPVFVLRDVSFEVRPGECLGIVGATGSGKSTLINLLLRFHDVSRGQIRIDGIDIRELDLADLRGLFSVALQDVQLFTGTIIDNVRLGSGLQEEAVRAAARAVHASAFVERLPQGYASPVAERGATLSAGEKQLLSLARALAFDRRILILDEATSSVDTETELRIRQALRVRSAGRAAGHFGDQTVGHAVGDGAGQTGNGARDAARHTTIAIAHRLSTIQDMDRIVVLHKGAVRETGTHQQLLAMRGIYSTLFELQQPRSHSAASGLGSAG